MGGAGRGSIRSENDVASLTARVFLFLADSAVVLLVAN